MDYGTKDVIRGLLWANLIAGFILYVTYYRQLEGALALLRTKNDIKTPLPNQSLALKLLARAKQEKAG